MDLEYAESWISYHLSLLVSVIVTPPHIKALFLFFTYDLIAFFRSSDLYKVNRRQSLTFCFSLRLWLHLLNCWHQSFIIEASIQVRNACHAVALSPGGPQSHSLSTLSV
jgi:hypothetical protein